MKVKTDKSKQVSSYLRLTDKNGMDYKYNRETRRRRYYMVGECKVYIDGRHGENNPRHSRKRIEI